MSQFAVIFVTVSSAAVIGYFFGSVMTSEIVKLIYKVNPREHFSKNPGVTNSVRTFGIAGGVMVLIGDMTKVICAILIVRWIFISLPSSSGKTDLVWLIYCTSFFAALGHAFPVFFKFKGGKCVAVFFGTLILISPWIAIISMCLFISLALATKYYSVASIVSCFFGTILSFIPYLDFFYLLDGLIKHSKTTFWYATYAENKSCILGIGIILLLTWILICLRHRHNIKMLLNKTENKIEIWSKKNDGQHKTS